MLNFGFESTTRSTPILNLLTRLAGTGYQKVADPVLLMKILPLADDTALLNGQVPGN